MKIQLLLATLFALSPALMGMVKTQEVPATHAATLVDAAANLHHSQDSKITSENIEKITTTLAMQSATSQLNVILLLSALDIPAAKEWLDAKPETHEELKSQLRSSMYQRDNDRALWATLLYRPELCEPYLLKHFLTWVLPSCPVAAAKRLVDTPSLRREFVVGDALSLICSAALKDPEKLNIFVAAFGWEFLIDKLSWETFRLIFQDMVLKVFNKKNALMVLLARTLSDRSILRDNSHIFTLRNESGQTLLMKIAEYVKNKENFLGEDMKVSFESLKSIRAIFIAHSDVNATDNQGETALIKAVKKGNLETARALVGGGADESIRDVSGKTCNDYLKEAYANLQTTTPEEASPSASAVAYRAALPLYDYC
jgi:Ankyrin repeats (many copies)